MQHHDVVILANGQFPSSCGLLAMLSATPRLVCCDGAYARLVDAGVPLAVNAELYVTGDGDSLPQQLKDELGSRFIKVDEQDYNDLGKAFRLCCAHNWADIAILGATGLREDHTLGNISYLALYGSKHTANGTPVKPVIYSDYGVMQPVYGRRQFPSHKGQQISIFSLTPQHPVSAQGLRYPLQQLLLTQWWMGTLNEALGDTFVVDAGQGSVILFTEY
ncbi:MAG: thiamine diphosphokinase [Bacteroidales bacterium]|nr:thiamine diphosphokinase [Bacteroidales bacterium]